MSWSSELWHCTVMLQGTSLETMLPVSSWRPQYLHRHENLKSHNPWLLVSSIDYLTNSIEKKPRWEANSHSASQQIPCLLGTWRFITVFTTTHHWSLSSARWIQSKTSYCISISHSSIIFPSTPRSSKWSLPFRFLTKFFYAFLISAMCATCTVHLILLALIILTFGKAYKLWSSLCILLQPPTTLPLRSKYSHQYPVLRHSQSMFFP